MVRAAQVQASSLMRAIAPHTSGCRRGAAPHLPASPTNRRRSTLGASHVIALAPWPLVLRLSPRPAWAMIGNSLPRRPHAGLGTYPRVPYVSTPRGTQGFGDRRAVLVILSCDGTRRISQHRIACSTPLPSCGLRDVWCADLSHFYPLIRNKSRDLIENQTKYTFFHRIKYRFPRA